MPFAVPVPRRWLSRRLLVLAATALAAVATAQEVEKLTYDDHVRPVLENKCFSCHNPDKKKGGLDLTSYAALLSGGGGGAVVDPGNPASSRLWTCSSKKEEPFMPPEGAPLEAKDLTLLSKWIAGVSCRPRAASLVSPADRRSTSPSTPRRESPRGWSPDRRTSCSSRWS